MPGDDDAPLSSYSDPFYDRLDALARQVRRMWWLFALAIIIVALSAVLVQRWMFREPTAVGAAAALTASKESDPAKREAAWKKLAEGADNDAGFRATAYVELAKIALERKDAASARTSAERAEALAQSIQDDDLRFAAQLTRAAATLDGGDAQAALDLYEKIAKNAGAQFPARKLPAELGAALCLEKQGRIDDAILRLEPLTARSDEDAKELLETATSAYWHLKRQQAEGTAKPVSATAAEAVPAAATVAAPVAPKVLPAAATAPAPVAATAPATATPAAPK